MTASVAGLLLLCSIAALAGATFPRTRGPKRSLLYFGGITSYDSEAYLQQLLAESTDQYLADLARQCHRNAEIAAAKFHLLRLALFALFCSVVPWLIAVAGLYACRQP